MTYVIPALGFFVTTLEEAQEKVADLPPEQQEVWAYDMAAPEFLMKHWVSSKVLPEPSKKGSFYTCPSCQGTALG